MVDQSQIPEEMAAFFDARAEGYVAHMRSIGTDGLAAFYAAVAEAIPETDAPLRVLDLGAGTGLELAGLFARAPRARVTCIDLSGEMLVRLQARYVDRSDQISLVQGSFLGVPYDGPYDIALSVMAMHHYAPDIKQGLYARIHAALAAGGRYIEGDYVTSPREETKGLALLERLSDEEGISNRDGELYHLDIPFSIKTQRELLQAAGFSPVQVTYYREAAAVFVAHR